MNQQIDQYKILSELGAGGMGVVYRAVDVLLERQVAIKRLRAEFAATPTVLERFRREAQLQARLNHLNIAQLYALVQDGESLCIVMEFVEGTSLSQHMPMSWRDSLPIVLQILDGLEYAHRRGVLHHDIKPENIIISRQGTVKVMDFGIAYALGSVRPARDIRVAGTIEYMSPERILGRDVDERSDIYSVGILFFEVLSGRLPFQGRSAFELLRSHVELQSPPVSQFVQAGVPGFIESTLCKAMAKDPVNRFGSCAEMAAWLRENWGRSAMTFPSASDPLDVNLRE